jgi:hypothetical protein
LKALKEAKEVLQKAELQVDWGSTHTPQKES